VSKATLMSGTAAPPPVRGSGQGLAVCVMLNRLKRHHGTPPAQARPLPLAPPTSGPVILRGLASTAGIDLGRHRFLPGSLSWDASGPIPVCLRNDKSRVVGEVKDLDYRSNGDLHVTARVDDAEAARLGGFSVCAHINEFEVRNPDDAEGYHVAVTAAELVEVTVTERPCNPEAVVQSREPDHHAEALACIARMQARIATLREILARQAARKEAETASIASPVLETSAEIAEVRPDLPRWPPRDSARLAQALRIKDGSGRGEIMYGSPSPVTFVK
jgi:hypothetical protein